jgi:hypothetical protein
MIESRVGLIYVQFVTAIPRALHHISPNFGILNSLVPPADKTSRVKNPRK